MDPITLAAALLPLLGKAGEAVINRWIAPKDLRPATVDDAIKLGELEIRRFEVLNSAGGVQPSYPWVAAVIQLQRPAVIAMILAMAGWQVVTVGEPSEGVWNALGIVGSYLFMDRTLFHLGKAKG